jgi:hypothetical protein
VFLLLGIGLALFATPGGRSRKRSSPGDGGVRAAARAAKVGALTGRSTGHAPIGTRLAVPNSEPALRPMAAPSSRLIGRKGRGPLSHGPRCRARYLSRATLGGSRDSACKHQSRRSAAEELSRLVDEDFLRDHDLRVLVGRPFDERAFAELGAGSDQRNRCGRVDRSSGPGLRQ